MYVVESKNISDSVKLERQLVIVFSCYFWIKILAYFGRSTEVEKNITTNKSKSKINTRNYNTLCIPFSNHANTEQNRVRRAKCCFLTYVTCCDYLATMFTETITVNGSEQLGNIQVPKRASYIQVILLELSRMASHLLWLSPFMADIGAYTLFFYIFEKENWYMTYSKLLSICK